LFLGCLKTGASAEHRVLSFGRAISQAAKGMLSGIQTVRNGKPNEQKVSARHQTGDITEMYVAPICSGIR
jgi:hypothetical protein